MCAVFGRHHLTGSRITAPIAMESLRRAGPIGSELTVVDIAAGSGALSLPAAYTGASVLAVDIAPGMVNRRSERLAPFPYANAKVMDGQDLKIEDASFELFALEERSVLRYGESLREADHSRSWQERYAPSSPPPQGLMTLSNPARLAAELLATDLVDIEVTEFEAIWQGPSGEAYLDELHDLHRYMEPCATLDIDDRRKVDDAILHILEEFDVGDQVRITSPVPIAIGTKQ